MDSAAPKMNRGSQSFSLLLLWIFFILFAAQEEKFPFALHQQQRGIYLVGTHLLTRTRRGSWSPVTPRKNGKWLSMGKLGILSVSQD